MPKSSMQVRKHRKEFAQLTAVLRRVEKLKTDGRLGHEIAAKLRNLTYIKAALERAKTKGFVKYDRVQVESAILKQWGVPIGVIGLLFKRREIETSEKKFRLHAAPEILATASRLQHASYRLSGLVLRSKAEAMRTRRRQKVEAGGVPGEYPIGYLSDGSNDPKWAHKITELYRRVDPAIAGETPRPVAEQLGFDLSGGKWGKPYDILHNVTYRPYVEGSKWGTGQLKEKIRPTSRRYQVLECKGDHSALTKWDRWHRVQWILDARSQRHKFGLLRTPDWQSGEPKDETARMVLRWLESLQPGTWNKGQNLVVDPREKRMDEIARLSIENSPKAVARMLGCGQKNANTVVWDHDYEFFLGEIWRKAHKAAKEEKNLPRILSSLVDHSEGVTLKTIARETGLSKNLLSAYLNRLLHNHIVNRKLGPHPGASATWQVQDPVAAKGLVRKAAEARTCRECDLSQLAAAA